MKLKELKNKWAITTGLSLATLDFILIGGYGIYVCATGASACGEVPFATILHMPTMYIFFPLFPLFNSLSESGGMLSLSIMIAIAGVIQYFIVGYLIGYVIFLIKEVFRSIFQASRKS